MANAILSASVLADLAVAFPGEPSEDAADPLVSVEQPPASEGPEPAAWPIAEGSLSAWAPANREHPICEVREVPRDRRWLVVSGGLGAAAAAAAAWFLLAA